MRVLVDTNVVIDVLQNRQPWSEDGKKLFYAVANKQIEGFITAKEATDIYFISRRQFSGQKNLDQKARKILYGLFDVFEVADTLGVDCINALENDNKDYEDAVMIACAMRIKADAIITRNPKDFKDAPVSVLSPADFAHKYLD